MVWTCYVLGLKTGTISHCHVRSFKLAMGLSLLRVHSLPIAYYKSNLCTMPIFLCSLFSPTVFCVNYLWISFSLIHIIKWYRLRLKCIFYCATFSMFLCNLNKTVICSQITFATTLANLVGKELVSFSEAYYQYNYRNSWGLKKPIVLSEVLRNLS